MPKNCDWNTVQHSVENCQMLVPDRRTSKADRLKSVEFQRYMELMGKRVEEVHILSMIWRGWVSSIHKFKNSAE